MRKTFLILGCCFVFSFSFSQTVKRNDGESIRDFVNRMYPEKMKRDTLLLVDSLNNSNEHIAFTYMETLPEVGENGHRVMDSVRCYYLTILSALGNNEYSKLETRLNCLRANSAIFTILEINKKKKERRIMAQVGMMVRMPGGVLRQTTIDYFFRQEKEGDKYTDKFVKFEE